MAKRKPDFRVCVSEQYTTDNGEVKSYFSDVGVGWFNSKGGANMSIRAGISISGSDIILVPTDERKNADENPQV